MPEPSGIWDFEAFREFGTLESSRDFGMCLESLIGANRETGRR